MTKLWCETGELKVIELKNKMYQFVFTNEEERLRVLEKRPWTFDHQILVLQPWKEGIENDPNAFLKTQIWVQAWQIPGKWLTTEAVWKIGQIFNKCLNVVIPENGSKEGRFATLLVEVDLQHPLIRGTRLRCNGEVRWVTFRYEMLPFFCFYCGKIGHGERNCEQKMNDSQNAVLVAGQFGDWLRASNSRGASRIKNWGRKELASDIQAKTQRLDNSADGGRLGTNIDSVQLERDVGEREGRLLVQSAKGGNKEENARGKRE